MEEGIKERAARVNFLLRPELNRRLESLCSHKGDKNHYLNLAIEFWLSQHEDKVAKFNEKIKV